MSALGEETFLADDLLRQLMSVGEVDLLVGISPHHDVNAVNRAAKIVEQCFQQHFARQRVAVITVRGREEADVASGSPSVHLENPLPHSSRLTSLRTIDRVTADFSITPSPGLALHTVVSAAVLLRARACAIVSPATANLTSDWIANLLRPAYREKFSFVAPLYTRHKYQGLLARNLLYPMCRAIFGCGIRELYADEWGFSDRLASLCLDRDVWNEEAVQLRPEGWMALTAMTADLPCCQSFLGQKLQPVDGAALDIVEVFRQAVGSLFWCLETEQATWLARDSSQPVPTFGLEPEITTEPTDINVQRMLEMFRGGVQELQPILGSILTAQTSEAIRNLAAFDGSRFTFPPDLWVRVLYEFAASYHHAVINRDHVVQALVPLYRGMTYSYLTAHLDSTQAKIQAENEALCAEFENQKPYLRERWKASFEVKS